MNTEIIALILIILVLIGTIIFFWYILKSIFFSQKKAPYISTFDRHLELMKQLDIKPKTNLVDLWCWNWKALRFFMNNFKLNEADGYDINRFAIYKWKWINKRQKHTNIKLNRSDFSKADLKKYDYIYVYLRDTQLEDIEDWIWQDKKDWAIVISNTFQFKKHKPFKTYKNKQGKDTIFLYK
jgi:hypothetical protein